MSSENPQPLNQYTQEFDEYLAEAEEDFLKLKQRYAQFKESLALKQQEQEIQQELATQPTPELERQLKQVQEKIAELEIILESFLLSNEEYQRMFWEGLRKGLIGEIFWQVVRFGGLGVLVGWFLKSFAG